MGTYYIPRNLRGESRILYIFTIKSLITTAVGGLLGSIFFFLFNWLNLRTVGIVIAAIFALIGFGVGAIKIPNLAGLRFTKSVGGESIDEIVKRYVKFKMNKKLYTYTKEEK